jgi:hypothetical protein
VRRTRGSGAAEDFRVVKPHLEKYLHASWHGKKRPSVGVNTFDPQQEALFDMLLNMAANDGDAYRDGKNAKRAIETAYREYTRNVETMLREDFSVVRPIAITQLTKRWRSTNPCGRMNNPTILRTVELSKPVGKFTVKAVEASPGEWLWEMWLGDEYLDGGVGAVGVDSYPTAESALDMGEYLVKQSDEWELVRKGMTQFRHFDFQDLPNDVHVAWGPGKTFDTIKEMVVVKQDQVEFYYKLDGNKWGRDTIYEVGPLMSPRLTVSLAQQMGEWDTPEREELTSAQVREVFDQYKKASTHDKKSVAAALQKINAYRSRMAQAPLDPKASGWSDDDIVAEAARIGERNPRSTRNKGGRHRSRAKGRAANPGKNGREGPGRHGNLPAQ